MSTFSNKIVKVLLVIAGIAALPIGILSLTEPLHPTVTDADKCGQKEITKAEQLYEWKECANPNKIVKYKNVETVSSSSGWVRGGKNRQWHCNNVKNAKQATVKESISWSDQKTSEENKKRNFHAYYNYHCSIVAKWGPVFQVERWEGCGKAEPVTTTVKIPATCVDETEVIGWRWKWQNKSK